MEPAPEAIEESRPPPPTELPRTDPHRLIAGLARAQVKLELGTTELCFLAALYLRSDRAALASFEDDALVDVYEQVCDLVTPGVDSPRRRATHAIHRLREDRLLQRVDGAGLVRTGEYTLTGLAAAVVEFFLRDETLTRESLVLLTRVLHLNLAEIRNHARTARGDTWSTEVVGPLSVTVRDLVDGIRRRQRGLDADQEEVQQQIGQLLDEQWLEAVGACERLLDATSATLRELNEVLLRDTHQFVAVLQEIGRLAAGVPQAEEAVQRVIEQVDVIAAWGSARQRAWSEYYQYVHRFLQDVVRLDPDRALSQRLRDLIAHAGERPFALAVAHAPSIRLLRPVRPRRDRPPVTRPRELRERPIEVVATEDERAWLEERVFAALADGAQRLAEVTARVLEEVPEHRHPVVTGRIAALVAELAWVTRAREAPWTPVSDALEIGDWTIDGLREAP
ncbi:MAG: condensin subunit MukF [Myxococcota bacterium]